MFLRVLALSAVLAVSAHPFATVTRGRNNSNLFTGHMKRQTSFTATPIPQDFIDEFTQPISFAGAAYCDPIATFEWSCGANCDAIPGFVTTAAGGDGQTEPFWFVGYWPAFFQVVVVHQGTTDANAFEASLLGDGFELETPDATLFPGIGSTIQIHNGFAATHALSAENVLSAVLASFAAQTDPAPYSVLFIGHSLGAALALLDYASVPLRLQTLMPGNELQYQYVGLGLPRVGNQAFANYVQAQENGLLWHVNNIKDPIPTLPAISAGFHHPSGEMHRQSSGTWQECSGQDNPLNACIVGNVPSPTDGIVGNNLGPYSGVTMGC